MTKTNPKELYLEEYLALLLNDKKVAGVAIEEVGSVEQVRKELTKKDPFDDTRMACFADRVIELLAEGEVIDSATIECLSSYSTTANFELIHYGGIYHVSSAEFDNSGYFKTAEDAKAAVGIAWDKPEDYSSDISGDHLADLIEDTDDDPS